ncbi:MAG TPA: adenylate/guanylate cyclase domain-containing protein [Rhodoglobus sp.]|nr:adenylate/guanylate cyclase domain-containing protein [Rhodoglobus sp.]
MSAASPPSSSNAAAPSAGRAGLSIRSILLIMLLLVSVGSSVVVGLIGYVNGQSSLREAAFDRLTEVRDSRAREVRSLFENLRSTLQLSARGESAAEAVGAFSDGYVELTEAELSDDDAEALETFYADEVGPRIDGDASTFVPSDAAQRYLQAFYTAQDPEAGDVGDGSDWSQAHAEYHGQFQRMAELFGFGDVLLLNDDGQIVYTVQKGIDLGADVDDGPLQRTGLALAFADALTGNVADTVVLADYGDYPPAFGTPVGWAVAPIADDGAIVGALAVALPTERLDAVMTGGGVWDESGLGRTGETYLVGPDRLMRSTSRELVQRPERYEDAAVAGGTPRDVARSAIESGSTLLIQPVTTQAVELGQAGEAGTVESTGYLGEETIAAVAPLDILGLDWVVVAEIESAEAFEPIAEFSRNLAISSAILVLAVSVLSLIIAGFIVRPLRRLRDAARRIASGELGVQVDAGTSDELADVGAAFNDMSRSLQVKATLLEEQQAENERLLLSLMPETLVQQYREGRRTIAFDHQEVTVLFADIVGFEAFSRGMTSEQALEKLNEILRAFDEAADRFGIERVRTTRAGYLASCGLTIPRVDNARRTVDFAVELARILQRFSGKHGADLSLRAGLDTGTVTSGLVGQSHIAYDLWGDAVNLAFQVQSGTDQSGIFLTQAVVDRMPDTVHVRDWGFVTTATGPQRVWRVDPEDVDHG